MESETNPNPERAIFEQALEHPPGAERKAFLDRASGGCPEMLKRVEALLLADASGDGFLPIERSPEDARTVLLERGEGPGARIGRYKLLEQIGEGGMGVVFMAEQEEPVRRRVALKIIKLGMDTKSVTARFEAERQALALMDHPNIARVLDGGATDSGRPYFVMELVQGAPITEFCDRNRLSAEARLRLFMQVCQAIQSAHQKGVIHRDIKPSNVLVTLRHGEPMPKVIDFGIAKAINQKLTEKTLFTRHATLIGTPAYMSPEQAEMSSMDVDTRADIYSLGVLLYELLTGSTPFPEKRLRSLAYGQMQRVIMEEEPERPSARLSTLDGEQKTAVARDRSAELRELSRLLRGDLDWIVMKALEKDRTRRYETANGLAGDLARHLENEPIAARPPSAAYRLQKFVRRNKLAFGAGLAVVVALVGGLGAATWQAVLATREREEANQARAIANREQAAASLERDRARAHADRAEQALRMSARNAYAAAMAVAQADWDSANLPHLRELLDETKGYSDKGFEWYYWQRMVRSELFVMRDHDAAVASACFSPDGTLIASGGADRAVRVWEASGGCALRFALPLPGEVLSLAFSRDGRHLLTVSTDGIARLIDAKFGQELRAYPAATAALSPAGTALLIASTNRTPKLLDWNSGEELWDLGERETIAKALAFSSDGGKFLSAGLGGSIHVWAWDQTTRPNLLWEQIGPGWEKLTETRPAAFSPDGGRLALGGRDRIVRILDATNSQEIKSFSGHSERVTAVAFSPDGGRVASASLDRTIKIWELEEKEARMTLRGHEDQVTAVAFSPDGRRLASASADRTVRVWDALAPAFPRIAGGSSNLAKFVRFTPTAHHHRNWEPFSTNALQLARFSPDGRHILTASKDHTARIWDAGTLMELRVLRGASHVLTHANYSPDGKFITAGSHDGSLRLWDAATGEPLRVWREDWGNAFWSRINRAGTEMVSSMGDGLIRVWDLPSGEELRKWKANEGGTWAVEYSPDEKTVATAGGGGAVKLWDVRTGAELLTFRGHRGVVVPLAFSPDGKRLATGGRDRTIRVWDTSDGGESMTIRAHLEGITDINFSLDGRRFVSASADKTVRIWDAASGRQLLTLRGNSDFYMAAVFSPDGQSLACAGDFPFFELWEAATDAQVSRWQNEESNALKRWAAWDAEMAARNAKD